MNDLSANDPPPAATPAVQAICLLSGGLDSQLAVCLLRAQGITVEAICFESPYFNAAPARRAARALDVRLHCLDFSNDITALLENPSHGFGKEMNPCRDCHARMIRRAGEWMASHGFDFIATGEVLNQRPLSQTRAALTQVARDSGFAEWLVRPLCARHLPETTPEIRGQVDRSRLLDLQGRGRKRQFALADQYGLQNYPTPAGGCRLTEPNFCRRLRDLRDHEGLRDLRSVRLLLTGRYLRLPDGTPLHVGRNAADNLALEAAALAVDFLAYPTKIPGPTLLAPGGVRSAADREWALRIGAAFCGVPPDTAVAFHVRDSGGNGHPVHAIAMERDALAAWLR